jgi:hypothetical protein
LPLSRLSAQAGWNDPPASLRSSASASGPPAPPPAPAAASAAPPPAAGCGAPDLPAGPAAGGSERKMLLQMYKEYRAADDVAFSSDFVAALHTDLEQDEPALDAMLAASPTVPLSDEDNDDFMSSLHDLLFADGS